jgi:phosphatidate phosphatase PAH1
MARWKLACAHYLNLTDSAKWEYSEVDRQTGRPKKRVFNVPTLLDPQDPASWNNVVGRDDGEIIVTNDPNSDNRDYIFIGKPTPDMIPLDDEAKKQSSELATYVPNQEGQNGDALIQSFQAEMEKIRETQSQPQKIEGVSELLTAITQMMAQNQQMMTAMIGDKSAAKSEGRRV